MAVAPEADQTQTKDASLAAVSLASLKTSYSEPSLISDTYTKVAYEIRAIKQELYESERLAEDQLRSKFEEKKAEIEGSLELTKDEITT